MTSFTYTAIIESNLLTLQGDAIMNKPIFNAEGEYVSLEAAIYYMDAELLKTALIAHPFDDTQAFFDEYCKLHKTKFNKPFEFEN